jgi:WhiB family redox-sensing transcriptional regulator
MDEPWAEWLIGCGPWRHFAACRSADPELFFPVTVSGRQVEEAKAICAGCSVRSQCLMFATLTSQEHGIWGGLRDEERRTPEWPVVSRRGTGIGLWDMKSAIGSNR